MRALWLPGVLRDAGLTVVEHAGWRTRGSELRAIHGVVCHHTATSARTSDSAVARLLIVGRADLKGPLCQLGLRRSGVFDVITSGRGSHNGFGRWGNDSIGIEAYNDGVGEPWRPVQVDAYQRGCAAICRHLRLSASFVQGHKETDPRRKIDPAGIDMHAFRARVTDLLKPTPPPAAVPPRRILRPGSSGPEVVWIQACLAIIHNRWQQVPDPGPTDGEYGPKTAAAVLAVEKMHNAFLTAFTPDAPRHQQDGVATVATQDAITWWAQQAGK
ncbi:MAG TPA: N-acetylmuramoyl-L-alanine amidase [Aquihabitans sp.]|jgi:hypothetical protein|nr:N-acetylmuramoyl-L-alanine amidase [Aquihabitans sp.]